MPDASTWAYYGAICAGSSIGYIIGLILAKLLIRCYDAWLQRRQARRNLVESELEGCRREIAEIYELLARVEQGGPGRSREG